MNQLVPIMWKNVLFTMWFPNFVTDFNQSYNCQTSHYPGRNRLPNACLMLPSLCQPAQIQPKSQFLFHKNLPSRDFSIMTLLICILQECQNDRDTCYKHEGKKIGFGHGGWKWQSVWNDGSWHLRESLTTWFRKSKLAPLTGPLS